MTGMGGTLPEHSLRRLLDVVPLIALTFIFYISCWTVYAQNLWWPLDSYDSLAFASLFLFVVSCILYNYLRACYVGPGYLPLGWTPKRSGDRQFLQYCDVCQGYKAPRAHHCRQCNRCVKKMDHHCPWLGNCLGHDNHANFVYFLGTVVAGCTFATYTLSITLVKLLFWDILVTSGIQACRVLQEKFPETRLYSYKDSQGSIVCSWTPKVDLAPMLAQILFIVVACILAIALAVGICIMLIGELQAIATNRTGIEEWIETKAIDRRRTALSRYFASEETAPDALPLPFVYPYDLGREENMRQVFRGTSKFGLEDQPLNGVDWPTVSGCGPYALTVEQLAQKADKMKNASDAVVVRAYSGKLGAGGFGNSIRCTPFVWTAETRLSLGIGETLKITREDGDWMYGWRDPPRENNGPQEKGWFPARAVRAIKFKKDE